MPERTPQSLPPEHGATTRRAVSLRTRLIGVAGIAGTLIGILGIVVPLVVTAGTRSSSVDTVDVQQQGGSESQNGIALASVVEPLQAGVESQALGAAVDYASIWSGSYAVPVDAPWAELWGYQSEDCYTEQQIAWLETYGVRIPTPFLVALISNTATSGSPITIRNVRLQGVVSAPTGETVTVTYPTCKGDGVPGIYAHLTVGIDPVAVYDECYSDNFVSGVRGCRVGEGEIPPIPGDPLVFDILPGGIQQLNLTYDQVADFSGRFVADVEVDGQVSMIDLSPPGADIVSPAVTRPAWLSIGTADLTACQSDTDAELIGSCTLEQWLAMLRG